jgi:hypothetical protein
MRANLEKIPIGDLTIEELERLINGHEKVLLILRDRKEALGRSHGNHRDRKTHQGGTGPDDNAGSPSGSSKAD